jgi:hypothetical protein
MSIWGESESMLLITIAWERSSRSPVRSKRFENEIPRLLSWASISACATGPWMSWAAVGSSGIDYEGIARTTVELGFSLAKEGICLSLSSADRSFKQTSTMSHECVFAGSLGER